MWPTAAPPAPFYQMDDSCERRWVCDGGPGGRLECYVHAPGDCPLPEEEVTPRG